MDNVHNVDNVDNVHNVENDNIFVSLILTRSSYYSDLLLPAIVRWSINTKVDLALILIFGLKVQRQQYREDCSGDKIF